MQLNREKRSVGVYGMLPPDTHQLLTQLGELFNTFKFK